MQFCVLWITVHLPWTEPEKLTKHLIYEASEKIEKN